MKVERSIYQQSASLLMIAIGLILISLASCKTETPPDPPRSRTGYHKKQHSFRTCVA